MRITPLLNRLRRGLAELNQIDLARLIEPEVAHEVIVERIDEFRMRGAPLIEVDDRLPLRYPSDNRKLAIGPPTQERGSIELVEIFIELILELILCCEDFVRSRGRFAVGSAGSGTPRRMVPRPLVRLRPVWDRTSDVAGSSNSNTMVSSGSTSGSGSVCIRRRTSSGKSA